MKNKKTLFAIIGIIATIIIGVSISYAFFTYQKTGNDIELNSGHINVSFTEGTNNIQDYYTYMYPTSDALGMISDIYMDFDVSASIEDENIYFEIQLADNDTNSANEKFIKFYLTDQSGETVYAGPITMDNLETNMITKNRILSIHNVEQDSFNGSFRLRAWVSDEYYKSSGFDLSYKVVLFARNAEND